MGKGILMRERERGRGRVWKVVQLQRRRRGRTRNVEYRIFFRSEVSDISSFGGLWWGKVFCGHWWMRTGYVGGIGVVERLMDK